MDWFLYDNGLRHERVKYISVWVYKNNQKSSEKLSALWRMGRIEP